MPNHASAKKDVRSSEKARLVNRDVRTEIRTSLKKVRTGNAADAARELPNLFTLLDRAARRHQGGITKNSASNYKRKAQKAVATRPQ